MCVWHRKEGASLEQLKVCADADAADFHGKRLQDECPGFMWRSVFSDFNNWLSLTSRVTIPLTLPACQVRHEKLHAAIMCVLSACRIRARALVACMRVRAL